jgi:hypothetical protein
MYIFIFNYSFISPSKPFALFASVLPRPRHAPLCPSLSLLTMTVEVQSNGSQNIDPISDTPLELVKSVATEIEPDTAIVNKQKEGEEEKTKESTTLGSIMEKNSSFREESNFLTDLSEPEKKALFELRSLVETKLLKLKEGEEEREVKEMNLWGVPLLPSKCPESNNVILLKFLRAREFKVLNGSILVMFIIKYDSKFLGRGFSSRCMCVGD